MFLGVNMFLALLRLILALAEVARAKMSLSRTKNRFMPMNITSHTRVSSTDSKVATTFIDSRFDSGSERVLLLFPNNT